MEIPAIDPDELARRRDAGTVSVVDVRQPEEYTESHVPGAALIPLDQLADRAGEVPTDGTVALICRSGGRSLRAAEWLAARGHQVVNVDGGTLGWVEAGHPVATGTQPG